MKRCIWTRERFLDYARLTADRETEASERWSGPDDGVDLAPEEHDLVEAHLEECSSCRRKYEEEVQFLDLLRDGSAANRLLSDDFESRLLDAMNAPSVASPSSSDRPAVHPLFPRRLLWTGAAAALVLVASWLLYEGSRTTIVPPTDDVARHPGSEEPEIPEGEPEVVTPSVPETTAVDYPQALADGADAATRVQVLISSLPERPEDFTALQLDHLLAAVDDPDPGPRRVAWFRLKKVPAERLGSLHEKLEPTLQATADVALTQHVLQATAWDTYWDLHESLPPVVLELAVSSPDEWVRSAAMNLIVERQDAEGLARMRSILYNDLDTPNAAVIWEYVRRGLVNLPDAEIVETLQLVASRHALERQTVRNAWRAGLVRLGVERCLAIAWEVLQLDGIDARFAWALQEERTREWSGVALTDQAKKMFLEAIKRAGERDEKVDLMRSLAYLEAFARDADLHRSSRTVLADIPLDDRDRPIVEVAVVHGMGAGASAVATSLLEQLVARSAAGEAKHLRQTVEALTVAPIRLLTDEMIDVVEAIAANEDSSPQIVGLCYEVLARRLEDDALDTALARDLESEDWWRRLIAGSAAVQEGSLDPAALWPILEDRDRTFSAFVTRRVPLALREVLETAPETDEEEVQLADAVRRFLGVYCRFGS